jgi:hypothetical protein
LFFCFATFGLVFFFVTFGRLLHLYGGHHWQRSRRGLDCLSGWLLRRCSFCRCWKDYPHRGKQRSGRLAARRQFLYPRASIATVVPTPAIKTRAFDAMAKLPIWQRTRGNGACSESGKIGNSHPDSWDARCS